MPKMLLGTRSHPLEKQATQGNRGHLVLYYQKIMQWLDGKLLELELAVETLDRIPKELLR